MPEGHSIHRLARAMNQVFSGVRLRSSSPQGRFTCGAQRLDSLVFLRASALGKHLFVAFAPQLEQKPMFWLHVHLGIYGSWRFQGDDTFRAPVSIGAPRRDNELSRIDVFSGKSQKVDHETLADRWESWDGKGIFHPPEPRGQVRLRLLAPNGVADLSGPTRCELIDDEQKKSIEARLGPDPLIQLQLEQVSQGIEYRSESLHRLYKSFSSTRRPVGEVLMDQSKLAGVGNIYRAEACFVAKLNPHVPANSVSRKKIDYIWDWLVEHMAFGVDTGRVTTVRAVDVPDPLPSDDREAGRFYVYRRDGRPCLLCGSPVVLQMAAGRKLYWCPTCQP